MRKKRESGTKLVSSDIVKELAGGKVNKEQPKLLLKAQDALDDIHIVDKSDAIIEAIGDGIMIQDTDYKIIYQNQTQTNLYGNHVGEYCYKAYGDGRNICDGCPLEESFRDGKIHKAEKKMVTDEGTFYYEFTTSPLRDSAGKTIAGVKVVRNITGRKQVEEKLREGEHFLESIFESIQDGIGIIDRDMNIIHVNPTAQRWYPHTHSFIGRKCYEAYHGRSGRCEVCPAWRTLQTGESSYDVVRKSGPGGRDVGWLEIYSFPFIDTKTGQMRGVIEYVRDITERKHIEEEKDRLLKAIDSSTEGISIADEHDRYIYVNAAHAMIYGYEQDELVGKTWKNISPPEVISRGEDTIRENLHNKDVGIFEGELPGLRKDGTTIPTDLRATGLWDEKGNYRGHVCIVRDISERKRTEERLKLFSEAVEGAPDGVQIVDLDGYVTYSNRSVEEIYGFAQEELKGKHVNEMNVDPELAGRVILPWLKKTGRWVGELMVRHKDGSEFPIWLTASLVKDTGGKPIAMVGIIRDMTDRRRAEEAIRKYAEQLEEANRIKELFTDIMHHDLLNPLNIASGYIEMLKEDETDPQKKAYLEKIEKNLVKGVQLIENATMFSRLESLESIEFEEHDLKDVIEKVAENLVPLASMSGMRIENRITRSMPFRGNKIIEEVFSNFISNAIKYAAEGKKIILDCEDGKECWFIKVIDFGEGIGDADKTRIFERFLRTEKKGVKGSGLGLAIAKKIVELHRGRIRIEDNPEGGAVFVVELPKFKVIS